MTSPQPVKEGGLRCRPYQGMMGLLIDGASLSASLPIYNTTSPISAANKAVARVVGL